MTHNQSLHITNSKIGTYPLKVTFGAFNSVETMFLQSLGSIMDCLSRKGVSNFDRLLTLHYDTGERTRRVYFLNI